MPDMRKVRFKTSPDAAMSKLKLDEDISGYRTDTEATLSKESATKLVDGGFADYIDDRGYVLYEKNTRISDTPADAPVAANDGVKGKKGAKADEPEEPEYAQPVEVASPEEIADASASIAESEKEPAKKAPAKKSSK